MATTRPIQLPLQPNASQRAAWWSGVWRVVNLFDVGSNSNWDHHSDITQHAKLAAKVDQPIAGLIKDLHQRGLLDDTLIVGCSEFGRTPWEDAAPKGRGHYNRNFTCFMAGGGVNGGTSYGLSDEYGATAAENPVHTHDFHATILHLMGLDHTQLTYRYSGRDFRLTDIHGKRRLSDIHIAGEHFCAG